MDRELTLKELAADPLILMVMRADGVAEDSLQDLMKQVAESEISRLQLSLHKSRADEFYARLDESLKQNAPSARRTR